jgi:hypothetical protein
VEVDSTFLFSENNLPNFNNVVALIIAHFERNIDKTTQKYLASLLRDMFIDFSGLANNPIAL